MKKPLKFITVALTALLAVTLFISLAKSQVPPIPMTIDGYVLVRRVDGTNKTVPAGFAVYAKEGTTVINVKDPQNRSITDSNGYFVLGAAASSDGVKIDLWVKNVNVTRITFHQGTFLTLNLTVIDTTPPTIEIVSPQPNEKLPSNQPVWINVTLIEDFALVNETIKLTLNETELTPTYDAETGMLYCQTSPLSIGLYNVSVFVEDLAGNNASKTWGFTVAEIIPPTVTIINPTFANPLYIQSGKTIQVTYNYTEENPKNVTLAVYNATHTIASKTVTELLGGQDVQRTDEITIPAGTADGNYNLRVVLSNIYNLNATVVQADAVIVDNEAPTVSNPYQNPPGAIVQPNQIVDIEPGQNITIRVNVTDANPIKTVKIYYNTTTQQWQSIEMTKTTSNQYEATIPSSQLPVCTKLYYYIEAVDAADNKVQTPTAGVYFQSHIVPEYQKSVLIALLSAITLITALAKKRKRNSS
ncbi:hypothetical protein KEJ24_04885 [Candidatus Bathyarchaeota archaeon]|nr:hypothetical protein [Candidatus Bathyarchaeota archaeon]